jgi:hypothetical protein
MKIACNHFLLLDGKDFFSLADQRGKEGCLWMET